MKGSCVLFLLNLKNKDVHLILAQILVDKVAVFYAKNVPAYLWAR
jgi:hypothetical protein